MSSSPTSRSLLSLAACLLVFLPGIEAAAAGLQWPPPGKTDRLATDLTARNFYVVLDGSGSMGERACMGDGRKMDQAKSALEVFAKAVPRSANLGLLVFDSRGVSERVPLGTDNRPEFLRQVAVTAPSGGTPLREAIALARHRLEEQARRQLGYGEYNLIVVTDGEASSGQDPRPVVNELLARSPIVVHTVGFCISTSHSLNQPGKTIYKPANDRASLERGLEAALAEAPSFTADRFPRDSMNRNVIAFIAILAFGVSLLIGAYFARDWLTERVGRLTSDASGVTTTLRIGVDNWVGYLPLCSKELRTRMRGAGIGVKCSDDSADYAARMKRLREGELEFAVATVDALLLHGGKEKFPGTVIMVIDESSGGDAIVARKDRLTSLDDLKTRTDYRIAYTAGSPSEYLLKSIAVHFDVPPLRNRQGAWRVAVKDSAEALKQLRERKVDAAVLWEPDVSRALGEPGMHRVLGTENTRRLIVDVLAVNREFARANPDTVKLLLANYFRVLRHFRDSPDALADEVKSATRMSEQQVAAMLKGVRWTTLAENARDWFGVGVGGRSGGEGLIETLEATAQVLVESGDFRASPIPEGDPYRLQHRLYIEELYTTGLGAVGETAPAEPRGRAFAALTDSQWEKLAEVGTLKVRPITFASGTSDLSHDGKIELDNAAQNLAHYPNFRVVVRGHTGTRGDAASNQVLSLERAEAVKRYLLVTHGIDEARLRAVGYGGERPLTPASGEGDRAYQYRLPRVELYLASEAY